jgi:hypothetical protein
MPRTSTRLRARLPWPCKQREQCTEKFVVAWWYLKLERATARSPHRLTADMPLSKIVSIEGSLRAQRFRVEHREMRRAQSPIESMYENRARRQKQAMHDAGWRIVL